MISPAPSVMMVDDEKPFLDFLACMLTTNLGWDVHTFNRPRAALAALPSVAPAVIVTDYEMPELNGLQLIRAATLMRPGVPFVMITGHPQELAENPMMQSLSVSAVLPKPFVWRQLAEQIRRCAPEFAELSAYSQPVATRA